MALRRTITRVFLCNLRLPHRIRPLCLSIGLSAPGCVCTKTSGKGMLTVRWRDIVTDVQLRIGVPKLSRLPSVSDLEHGTRYESLLCKNITVLAMNAVCLCLRYLWYCFLGILYDQLRLLQVRIRNITRGNRNFDKSYPKPTKLHADNIRSQSDITPNSMNVLANPTNCNLLLFLPKTRASGYA